jgi:hypothetical protein
MVDFWNAFQQLGRWFGEADKDTQTPRFYLLTSTFWCRFRTLKHSPMGLTFKPIAKKIRVLGKSTLTFSICFPISLPNWNRPISTLQESGVQLQLKPNEVNRYSNNWSAARNGEQSHAYTAATVTINNDAINRHGARFVASQSVAG